MAEKGETYNFSMADGIEERRSHWTCYICKRKAPLHSLDSLESQEKSKKTEIFVDGNYRIYLRCPYCKDCFHAQCAFYELELILTKELSDTICEKCATKQGIRMSTDLRTLVLTNSDGSERRIQCQREVCNMLLSKETDPSVKSLVIQSLLNQVTSCSLSSPKGSDDQHSTSSDTSPPSSFTSAPSEALSEASSRSESPITCSENSSSTYIWKAEEEDILVNLRHDKNDKFLKCKNHTALWKDISAQLNETLQCTVSPNQAMNKYYSMKKRWKEIIDAPTGTERKHFRQKEQFDEMYGTKESTKPTVTLDTLEKKAETQGPKENKSTEQPRRKKSTVKRRSDVMEVLERHNKEFNEKMEQMHTDKMARLDRLLNLYEREIETRQSCNK
ncbi:uncharacterized protein LOC133198197 [Saccostrea echinata]|uniref:uncharacterized protein LOC133198197 n=1 Tax=Saccostrea echinata TaxID=191078 RepID=UPI002A7FA840|nr:uncharacterized protein LOC133198197 [Saccostrea echinata]